MRINLRIALAALIAFVAIGGFIGARIGLQAKDARHGVTVVVDFGADSKMAAVSRSVTGFNGTGWQLLGAAGFKVQGTAEYPSSFVCRIDGWPTSAVEKCMGTPSPTTGYWRYFIASAASGGRWAASGIGAAGHHPQCGTAEGWLWVTANTPVAAVPAIAPAVGKCE